MIRLGLVDFDTSHVVEFTKRLNHVDVAEDQWVEGAKIVMKQGQQRIVGVARQSGDFRVEDMIENRSNDEIA